MRDTTECPITIGIGSNILAGTDANKIIDYGTQALNGNWKKAPFPNFGTEKQASYC